MRRPLCSRSNAGGESLEAHARAIALSASESRAVLLSDILRDHLRQQRAIEHIHLYIFIEETGDVCCAVIVCCNKPAISEDPPSSARLARWRTTTLREPCSSRSRDGLWARPWGRAVSVRISRRSQLPAG